MTDLVTSTSDLTTYTFSAANIGDLGSNGENGSFGVHPHIRNIGSKQFFFIVHAEDALATFTASTLSCGGVGTSKKNDAGGLIAADTAIFAAPGMDLFGITNTDIVVTFSEAITSCAVGIVTVDNLATQTNIAAPAGTSGTGALTMDISSSAFGFDIGAFTILGTTCVTASLTEQVSFSPGISGCVAPMLLYEGSNAEMSYAAAWTYSPQNNGGNNDVMGMTTNWSGAGSADVIAVIYT